MKWRVMVFGLCAAFVAATAITSWCGGPPADGGTAPRESVSERSPQTPPSSPFAGPTAGDSAPAATGGFNPSAMGGAGLASVNGGVGASPQLSLGYANQRQYAWYYGAALPLQLGAGIYANVSADQAIMKFVGDKSYTGSPYFIDGRALAVGDQLSTRFNTSWWRVNGDVLWGQSLAYGSTLKVGPRVQYLNYNDFFEVSNETRSWKTSEPRNYSAFGLGAVGVVAMKNLVGDCGGSAPTYLKVAATFGKGEGMRYASLEGVAEAKASVAATGGELGVQVGLIYTKINETKEDPQVTYPISGGVVDFATPLVRTDRLDYSVTYPYVRGVYKF